MFAIVAALLFILAAFGVHMGDIDLVALGLCAVAIHLLIGNWPLGTLPLRRPNQ